MDFFQAQDDARKSTSRLVWLFIAAVLALIVMTNLLVMVFMAGFAGYFGNDLVTGRYVDRVEEGGIGDSIFSSIFWEAFFRTFDWQLFLMVGTAVIVVVAVGSLYKIAALSAGGKSVAEMLDGRLVLQNTDVYEERKILNVVEEMAIASGTPVPPVYVLPESGINAFAAGFSPGDAVIGVTEGCIKNLSRDELQGVVAHEFSHILNGDMRLNIRLIGLLHGILVIGMIGYHLLRSMRHSGRSRGNNAGPILALGLGLMAIGFGGSFFGSLIKASVSRQREYLADSSAVQFTRNPDGVAGALKKIGGLTSGSVLQNPAAPELSHAYFANGVRSKITSWFSTHPPLQERIKRIQPHWDGRFVKPQTLSVEAEQAVTESETKSKEQIAEAVVNMAAINVAGAVGQIGRPDIERLKYAHALIDQLPDGIVTAMREPYGARAIIYCLLINKDTAIRHLQLGHIQQQADQGIFSLTKKLLPLVDKLDSRFRLPLIDGAMAALRQMSPQQYQLFKKNLLALIKADKKISLFEWALHKIVFHNLDADYIKQPIFAKTAKFSRLKKVKNEVAVVLSLLAYAEHKTKVSIEHAFNSGRSQLPELALEILPKAQINLGSLNDVIDKLNYLKPLLKPRVLKACAACIGADGKVSASERELLRAFSAALDCPMPPLLD